MSADTGVPLPIKPTGAGRDGYSRPAPTTSHAARCTARHGFGSHADPPTMECAIPTGKKFAR
jgi:hypothetical protein